MKARPLLRDDEIADLVRRYQGRVRGFLSFLGCPPDRLDDMVQDVFLSFLSSRFQEKNEASTVAFLRTVARNLWLKTLERERRRAPLADLAAAEAAWVEFEAEDGGSAYLDALRGCLEGLQERSREVLGLRYRGGLVPGAIAERLGLKESGVKSILVRAKRRLRECVEERLP